MTSRAARPRVEWRSVDGILLFDKAVGASSNQALQTVRRLYRAEKAGHTGSLDPLASGVLPLCFGQATKVAGLMLDLDKTYEATVLLGARTATGDAEGAVIESCAVPALTVADVAVVLARFRGVQTQVPPMYSALKHEGEPLYALARRGVEIDRAARTVTVHALELLQLTGNSLTLRVSCTKGTYIRTLGEDIARALGTVGHLVALRRTVVGAFSGQQVYTLEMLEAHLGDEAALDALLLPVDAALHDMPAVTLPVGADTKFRLGQAVALAAELMATQHRGSTVRVYGADGDFIGTGRLTDRLEPMRLMSRAPDSKDPQNGGDPS